MGCHNKDSKWLQHSGRLLDVNKFGGNDILRDLCDIGWAQKNKNKIKTILYSNFIIYEHTLAGKRRELI